MIDKTARKKETKRTRGNKLNKTTLGDAKIRNRKHIDIVERTLIGATPTDPLEADLEFSIPLSNRRANQLKILRDFLNEQPEVSIEFAQHVNDVWKRTKEKPKEFLGAVFERRLDINSRAELSQVANQVVPVTSAFRQELSRYLDETGGFSSMKAD